MVQELVQDWGLGLAKVWVLELLGVGLALGVRVWLEAEMLRRRPRFLFPRSMRVYLDQSTT